MEARLVALNAFLRRWPQFGYFGMVVALALLINVLSLVTQVAMVTSIWLGDHALHAVVDHNLDLAMRQWLV